MKSYKVEKFIFIFSIVALAVFGISLPMHFLFGDGFFLIDLVSRLLYIYGGISMFVIAFIARRRRKRGCKNPICIEAMQAAKKELPNKIYKFCSLTVQF